MHKNQEGFTLIELLVAIAIIGLLASVLLQNVSAIRARANDSAAVAYLRHCVTSIESSRQVVNQELPNVTSCEDGNLGESKLPRPQSVKNSAISIQVAQDSYMVTVTSITGKVFKHDGRTILASAS